MQVMQSPSPRTRPRVAPHDEHDEHGGRWKLGPLTWPLWRRGATTDNVTAGVSSPSTSPLYGSSVHNASSSGEGVQSEVCATALLQEYELHDAVLVEARRHLEALEADPETDELPLVMARHAVFSRKHYIAQTFAG